MTIALQNVKLYRGDTAVLTVTLTNADGTPFDPAIGSKIKWRLAPSSHAMESEVLVRKERGDGIATIAGGITITLSAADTDQVPGLYHHELKIFDLGDVATAMTGYFVIKPAVQMGEIAVPPAAQLTLTASVPTVT